MRGSASFSVLALTLLGGVSCRQGGDQACRQKVKALEERIAQLEAAGSCSDQSNTWPDGTSVPDPNATYAVPIEGAPYVGPEYAKVTIVKVFEFA